MIYVSYTDIDGTPIFESTTENKSFEVFDIYTGDSLDNVNTPFDLKDDQIYVLKQYVKESLNDTISVSLKVIGTFQFNDEFEKHDVIENDKEDLFSKINSYYKESAMN